MDHKTTFSTAAAAVVASLAMVMPTGAQGACKTTLRGELVQAPGAGQAIPLEFLFFSLSENTQDNGTGPEKPLKIFQSFVIPNSRTTLPIPFALDIDSPKDCPGELELSVGTDRTEQRDLTPRFRLSHDSPPLTGGKPIHLDQFESILVRGPRF
jgi:hypothetical protein